MPTKTPLRPDDCNCLALRQAARHITQFYDQFLASYLEKRAIMG